MSAPVEKITLDKAGAFVYSEDKRDTASQQKEDTTMRYVCNVCGWVYDEEEQGVKWEDLPDDFACELCGVGKDDFSPEE